MPIGKMGKTIFNRIDSHAAVSILLGLLITLKAKWSSERTLTKN